jgi:hypothetical protein
MKLILKILLFAFAVVLGLAGCSKAKSVVFAKPYPVPPELPANLDEIVADQYPVHIYWSQTLSEKGYAQDRNGRINPPPEFEHFITSFDDTVFRYTPYYYILQTKGSYIKWQTITEKDFVGALHPTKAAFYNALGGGSFENSIGPLMMLYDGKLVKADDLTVVITDLEEQGLNNMKLAASIRGILSEEKSETNFSSKTKFSSKNAAAVIAVQLPFNGINYKPNADNRGQMLNQQIYGQKPLYIVVTGLRDPVTIFVNAFKVNAERNGVDCHIVSTLYPPEIESVSVSNVVIPQSATLSDQTKVDKNNRVLADLWNLRNTSAPERIWNLQNATKSSMFEVFGVKKPLNLLIFEYKTIGGGSKNGHNLWQLNIEFDKAKNLDMEDVAAVIENYRFLTPDTAAERAEPSTDRGKKEKPVKSKDIAGIWETNDTIMQRDLEISASPETVPGTNKVLVYVVPRNKKRPAQQSSVLYFEIVLRVPVAVPKWVDNFNDSGGGSTAGKTRGFYTFVEGILGIKPGEKTKALPEGHELLRLPVVLTGVPAGAKK